MSWLSAWIDRAARSVPPFCTPEVRAELAGPWRHAAKKPRVRIRADGWVRHAPGAFPFDAAACWVVVLFEGGVRADAHRADYWPDSWWKGQCHEWRWNIVAYRLVTSPRPRV